MVFLLFYYRLNKEFSTEEVWCGKCFIWFLTNLKKFRTLTTCVGCEEMSESLERRLMRRETICNLVKWSINSKHSHSWRETLASCDSFDFQSRLSLIFDSFKMFRSSTNVTRVLVLNGASKRRFKNQELQSLSNEREFLFFNIFYLFQVFPEWMCVRVRVLAQKSVCECECVCVLELAVAGGGQGRSQSPRRECLAGWDN